MYDRALLAFRNLEGLDPAYLSQKEARINERRGVVGFIPNTVEDSLKKIHDKYKKAMEDKVFCKPVQCYTLSSPTECKPCTPCCYAVSPFSV